MIYVYRLIINLIVPVSHVTWYIQYLRRVVEWVGHDRETYKEHD